MDNQNPPSPDKLHNGLNRITDTDGSESVSSNSEVASIDYISCESDVSDSEESEDWPSTASESPPRIGLEIELPNRKMNHDVVPLDAQKFNNDTLKKRLIFDSHCHLNRIFKRLGMGGFYNRRYPEPVAFLKKKFNVAFKKFDGCINVITNPIEFDEKYWSWMDEFNVYQAIGCHPESAQDYDDKADYDLQKAFDYPQIVALGEIGLDDFWANNNETTFQTQQKVFHFYR